MLPSIATSGAAQVLKIQIREDEYEIERSGPLSRCRTCDMKVVVDINGQEVFWSDSAGAYREK